MSKPTETLNTEEKALDERIIKEGWLPLADLIEDYANLATMIHVDTRDFHVNFTFYKQLENKSKKFLKELHHNKKVDYLTFNEVIERLAEWKEKSGGEQKWRLINHKHIGWFKYVRIFRTESGFVWCTNTSESYRFFTNDNLNKNIDFKQDY